MFFARNSNPLWWRLPMTRLLEWIRTQIAFLCFVLISIMKKIIEIIVKNEKLLPQLEQSIVWSLLKAISRFLFSHCIRSTHWIAVHTATVQNSILQPHSTCADNGNDVYNRKNNRNNSGGTAQFFHFILYARLLVAPDARPVSWPLLTHFLCT